MNLKQVLHILKCLLIGFIVCMSMVDTEHMSSASLILSAILGGILGLLISHKGLLCRTLSVLAGVIWNVGAVFGQGWYEQHSPSLIRTLDFHYTLDILAFIVGSLPGLFGYALASQLRKKVPFDAGQT
ncbi:MAG TPA: hypothetical protein V6C69_06195, partial [Trichormus sp.]